MIVLSYLLATSATIYFFRQVPKIVPERLSFSPDIPLWQKAAFIIGILITLYIIAMKFSPENGYSGDNLIFPILLLFMTTSLLIWALVDIQAKVKSYYDRTYSAVMSETAGAKEALDEATERLSLVENRESQLLVLDTQLKNKESEIQTQETRLQTLKERIELQEQQVISEKSHLDEILSKQIAEREEKVRSEFEAKTRTERDELQKFYNEKMITFVDNVTAKMEKRIQTEKKDLVDNVFSFKGDDSENVFELKKLKESIEKDKEEIQKSQFLLDIDQRVSQASGHVLSAQQSALEIKSENVDLRTELKLMANNFQMDLSEERMQREKSVDTMLHQLEMEKEKRQAAYQAIGNKLLVMDAQTKANLISISTNLQNQIKDLELKTADGFRQVEESISNIKLQFGQEIIRLDGQQGQILNELEKYYTKNQQFVNQCQGIALEAQRQNVNGQQLLNQVNHLYGQHKNETREIENRMRLSMDTIAVKEGQLANSVGDSMLKLKSLSEHQYINMKDMALEKKDIGLLWKEKNMEHDMNLQEIKHQQNDLDRNRQLFSQEQSAFNQNKTNVLDNARLTHRSYMAEQEHLIALQKTQNSGGFLSRWARNFENARTRS